MNCINVYVYPMYIGPITKTDISLPILDRYTFACWVPVTLLKSKKCYHWCCMIVFCNLLFYFFIKSLWFIFHLPVVFMIFYLICLVNLIFKWNSRYTDSFLVDETLDLHSKNGKYLCSLFFSGVILALTYKSYNFVRERSELKYSLLLDFLPSTGRELLSIYFSPSFFS